MHQNRPPPSSKTHTIKMRLGAQPFSWKWVLFEWEWKLISISKAELLPSFWNRGPRELGNGLLSGQVCLAMHAMFSPYKEFRIPKSERTGIQNPSPTDKDWNQVPRIGNPRLGFQNPIYLRFLYMGRLCSRLCSDTISYPVKYEGLSDIVWLSTWEIGTLQLRSVTEIAPK